MDGDIISTKRSLVEAVNCIDISWNLSAENLALWRKEQVTTKGTLLKREFQKTSAKSNNIMRQKR